MKTLSFNDLANIQAGFRPRCEHRLLVVMQLTMGLNYVFLDKNSLLCLWRGKMLY